MLIAVERAVRGRLRQVRLRGGAAAGFDGATRCAKV